MLSAGDACPSSVREPFAGLGGDVVPNTCLLVAYKLPPHQPHRADLIEGTAVDEVCDLANAV